MPASKRPGKRLAAAGIAALAALVLAAAGAYLVPSGRYRLYTDERASHCWRALHALASPTSRLRLVQVSEPSSRPGERRVTIEYRLDRVLGGRTLEAECLYETGTQRARSIALDGRPLAAAELARVNAQLAD